MLKKLNKIIIFIILIAALATISACTNNSKISKGKLQSDDNYTTKQLHAKNMNKTIDTLEVPVPEINQELLTKINTSVKVEIYHNVFNHFEEGYKPAVVTDKYIIDLIINFLKYKVEPSSESMSGMSAREEQKLIFYGADQEQTIIPFAYDSLYRYGYIEYKEYC